MQTPIQSLPVMRGPSKYVVNAAIAASGCNILKCGSKLARCIGVCVPNPFSQGCVDCLGDLWDECHGCVGL